MLAQPGRAHGEWMTALHRLDNGITLIADPMPQLQSVAVGIYIRAGTRDETPSENGVAHLLEHMVFKGAGSRSAAQIAQDIECVGGQINAGTTYQQTGYYVRILKEDLPLAVEILTDMVRRPWLDVQELAREKEVVLQEIGEAADIPEDVLYENLQRLMFTGQPLGEPILGTRAHVTSHDTARLSSFMERHYCASNIVIVAAGGVDIATLTALAEQYWADFAPSTNNEHRQGARPAAYYVGGQHHDPRSIEQTHLSLAYPGVGLSDERYFAFRLFTEILGGGMASRLFQVLREREGLAYSVYAYCDAYQDIGDVGFYAGVDADAAPAALQFALQEIDGLSHTVHQEELSRAKAMVRAAMLMGMESPYRRMERLAAQYFQFGEIRPTERMLDRVLAVEAGDICRCASDLLSTPTPSLSVVGPAAFDTLCDVMHGAKE